MGSGSRETGAWARTAGVSLPRGRAPGSTRETPPTPETIGRPARFRNRGVDAARLRRPFGAELEGRRRAQRVRWLRVLIEARLLEELEKDPGAAATLARVERGVERGQLDPGLAAEMVVEAFRSPRG